jgi:hypothetical protein
MLNGTSGRTAASPTTSDEVDTILGRALVTVTMMVLSCPNVSFSVQHYIKTYFSDKLFAQLRPFQVTLGPPGSTSMKAVMEDVKVRK